MKSLVVEDVAIIRKILSHYLSSLGDVDFAMNGLEALGMFCLALAEDKPYDLILLDIMLPKINGIQMLEKVREIENEVLVTDKRNEFEPVKIIMVSSLSDQKAVSTSIEKGCNGYITKPFDKDKIFNEIEKVGFTKTKKQSSESK